ncbi:MAG: phospholipase D-like domain-containing protein [Firmicutes bacterium]|nr:phospholipase D-like domain-containing protein [Bacillota bacterium]MDD4694517.1 phospholipase D-like domain-containing protein [Bacillota bacterium]
MCQKIFRWASHFAILFLVYLLVGGALVFLFHRPDGKKYLSQVNAERFLGETVGPDKAVIIENGVLSGTSRIYMIENAQDSLQIAYHAIDNGTSSDVFYGVVLEAAERGVQVQLLFDSVFHNLRGHERTTYWALVNHPNITIKFYEPLNLFNPWTFNNRLHDKFIIVDNTYVIIGGRNIGDRYFVENFQGKIVKDRDVLIYNTEPDFYHESVLSQFADYFNCLWSHSYTVEKDKTVPVRYQSEAWQGHKLLLNNLATVRLEHPESFRDKIDWDQYAHPTRKISLITNPLRRMNKEPWILSELNAMFAAAKDSVLIQSPYIIPSTHMRSYLGRGQDGVEIYCLTNSKASSPNYFAISGYLKHRDSIAKQVTEIYEYHGTGSIHAKSYVFDMRLSVVGSFNIDPRSSFLSTESMVVIDSEGFAENLAQSMTELARQSIPYKEELSLDETKVAPLPVFWYKTVLIGVLRILLYPFDALL